MNPTLLIEQVSAFRGAFPDIALPDDIRREDMGENALFVTLPIGKVGVTSRNGRLYSREAIEALVAEVNNKRPGGMFGHLTDAERATRFDPPSVRWLAATLAADGTAWGKAVVTTEQAREYFRVAKAANAQVATSIYGTATMDGNKVTGLSLESIDLADPARAGVPDTAQVPTLTKELTDSETASTPTEGVHILNELQTLTTRISELEIEKSKTVARVAELEASAARATATDEVIRELAPSLAELGIKANATAGDVIRELIAQQRAAAAAVFGKELDGLVAELVKVPALRPIVREQLGTVKNADAAKVRIAELLALPHIATIAEALVRTASGPALVLAPKSNSAAVGGEEWRNKVVAEATAKAGN